LTRSNGRSVDPRGDLGFCTLAGTLLPDSASAIMTESTEKKTVAERAADLSEDVLESVRDRQQTVIEAMRKFVDRLDEALPDLGDERRKKVLDALVDFADKLGTTTNDFVAKMVQSASGTLEEDTAKPPAD
jgi:hypothetical protein